ncbi:Fungal transcriptional regulatory protein, partial [Metarhizium hybridum]
MYWLPCQGFLHPDTTYKEIQEGTFDPVVAAAVCGITAVFVSPSDSGGEFGVKCSAHVEMYLFQNIYKFSDDLLVLFALSITFNLIRGEFAKLWQSFGVASRLMLGLRVNWDVLPQNQTFAQQECLRRIAWQLFYLDRMLAGGYEEYISCRAENMQIALPCSEAAFRENRPINAERLYDKPGSHPSTINLHGYQLRLIDLRHRIQVLQNELTRFHMSLPPEILLSDQTVAKYMASPERAGYVFLHTHLAVSHIDLYRFSLPGQRDKVSVEILRKLPREFIARSQKQAVAHAMCLGRFCDAIQNEVDQMHDTGKLKLAGDHSTFQMSTQCVRVLLVALQYGLYRDIADVTTAPLWRSVEVDEAHIRFLIDSVQRVTRPWCDILNVAQQAYNHNATLVEDFSKTRKVADQRAAVSMFGSKSEGSTRFPGPDAILESIATGKPEEYHSRMASHSPSDSTRWLGSHPSSPTPNMFATKTGTQTTEASQGDAAPGIPLFLAQARNRPGSATQDPLTYDAENSLMPMGDLDAVLPDTNPLMNIEGVPMSGMHSGDPSMFQQAIPQPSAGFLMAQQSVFGGDVFMEHYMNRQHGQGGYSQPPGGY